MLSSCIRAALIPPLFLILLLRTAHALESARTAEIGLSERGLSAITQRLQHEVDARNITGAVAVIARHGRIGYAQSVGLRDAETKASMQMDSIFRIASMTKAITSAAVLTLVEDGRLGLHEPLSKFLPEFERCQVLSELGGDSMTLEPAKRPVTIHDLLTHTSGLSYGWFGPEKLDALYQAQNVPDLFVPINETVGERVQRIARLPLKFQPGTGWEYGVSLDVLGRVVEVISGLTLEQFLAERIFRPLRMQDTFFYVPRDKISRLATLYTRVDEGPLVAVRDTPVRAGFLNFSGDYCYAGTRRFFSGGGGLASTADDYARFLQMLLNDGELDGVRVLQPTTVAQMTQNQIGDLPLAIPGHGDGFGYGFGVLTNRGSSTDRASVGTYSWGGIFNTYFWVDPQEQLIGVLLTQVFPHDQLAIREDFKRLTYEAIDESGFERVYWYEPGEESANPHFNPRQLRVNAPQVSIHPTYASRSEPRSSGMARILIDEDLVHYQGKYRGYDENGNRFEVDWHGMTKQRTPYGMLGSSERPPFNVTWRTSMLPAQPDVAVRALVELSGDDSLIYETPVCGGLAIVKPVDEQVSIVYADELPAKFWSRAGNAKGCSITLDIDPADILEAELHVVTWTGGAGTVRDYFTLNGRHFPVAEGADHEVVYSRLPFQPQLLTSGPNRIELLSDTEHHGIEVLAPGPALVIRHRVQPAIRLTEDAIDASAGDVPCYKIETPNAIYFLEKIGAGLSSMLDRDGKDWIGFHPQPGTGAAGEYRGFPNAVFKEEGSYFHPRNAGTDPCVTRVEEVTSQRAVISATSDHGKWAGRYEFTPRGCTFTMTHMPAGKKYWVLYEGTPGGAYHDTDWWMTSADAQRQPLTKKQDDDLSDPEWIAFGDQQSQRTLVLAHLEDDDHPDRFYQMQQKMTVFGFGRAGMQKYLDTVPQRFFIGFVESTDHREISEAMQGNLE